MNFKKEKKMTWGRNKELDKILENTAYGSTSKGLRRYWGGNSKVLKTFIKITRKSNVPKKYIKAVAVYLADRKFNGSSKIGKFKHSTVRGLFDELTQNPENILDIYNETVRKTTLGKINKAIRIIDESKNV